MVSYNFHLPSNVSSSLQLAYNEHSREDFFSILENNPDLFIELFEKACFEDQWIQSNPSGLKDITKQIFKLEHAGRFNQDQQQKIHSIWKRTLSSPHDLTVSNLLFQASLQIMSLEMALNVLITQESETVTPFEAQCTQYIRHKTGVQITRTQDGILEIKVKQSNEQTDQLFEIISHLEMERRNQLDIHLVPSNTESELNQLLEKYGKQANSLSLNNNIRNDEHFNLLIGSCLNLNRLFIHSDKITTIAMLPALVSLQKLYCSGCDNIKKLGQLPALQMLDCRFCSNIEKLERLPSLQALYCGGCPNIKKLRQLPALQMLDCSFCSNIKALQHLPALQTLNCSWCDNIRLGQLPALQTLDCSFCSSIKTLQHLPSLQTLDCGGCPNIKSLGLLPALQTLECCGCPNIKTLRQLPALQTLDCSGCDNIKTLQELPSLQTLDCNGCPSIKKLWRLPALQTLDCSGCENIKTLRQLPSLQTLDCSGCRLLELSSILRLVLKIYAMDTSRGKRLCRSQGIDSQVLRLFSQFKENDEYGNFDTLIKDLIIKKSIDDNGLNCLLEYDRETMDAFLQRPIGKALIEERSADFINSKKVELRDTLIRLYPPGFFH